MTKYVVKAGDYCMVDQCEFLWETKWFVDELRDLEIGQVNDLFKELKAQYEVVELREATVEEQALVMLREASIIYMNAMLQKRDPTAELSAVMWKAFELTTKE